MVTGDAVEKWLESISPDTVVYMPDENVACGCVVTNYAKTVYAEAYSSAPNYGYVNGEEPAYIFKLDEEGIERTLCPTDKRAERMMRIFDACHKTGTSMTAATAIEIIKEGKI